MPVPRFASIGIALGFGVVAGSVAQIVDLHYALLRITVP